MVGEKTFRAPIWGGRGKNNFLQKRKGGGKRGDGLGNWIRVRSRRKVATEKKKLKL